MAAAREMKIDLTPCLIAKLPVKPQMTVIYANCKWMPGHVAHESRDTISMQHLRLAAHSTTVVALETATGLRPKRLARAHVAFEPEKTPPMLVSKTRIQGTAGATILHGTSTVLQESAKVLCMEVVRATTIDLHRSKTAREHARMEL